VLYGFKTAHVFDVSQTEGKELPDFATVTGDPGDRLTHLQEGIRRHGIHLRFSNDLGQALGLSLGGTIAVREDLPEAKRFSVLVHEFAHELLHKGENRRTKTVRETEAEAVAYVVCTAVGLEPSTASSDYIHLYDGTKETLTQSLHAIREAASAILWELRMQQQ